MTDKKMIAVFHYDNGRCGSEPYRYEELKRGEWIDYEYGSGCYCSNCGWDGDDIIDECIIQDFDFCPYCGADMRKETVDYKRVVLTCDDEGNWSMHGERKESE